MEKIIVFAFQGDPVCFTHAMLNVLDMTGRGMECRLVIEGAATALIKSLHEKTHAQHNLYAEILKQNLLEGICQACSNKMGSLKSAREQGLPILADMAGHPSMAPYIERGYRVITL